MSTATADKTPAALAQAMLDRHRPALMAAPFEMLSELWGSIEAAYGMAGIAWLGRNDRYFMLVRLLHRLPHPRPPLVLHLLPHRPLHLNMRQPPLPLPLLHQLQSANVALYLENLGKSGYTFLVRL